MLHKMPAIVTIHGKVTVTRGNLAITSVDGLGKGAFTVVKDGIIRIMSTKGTIIIISY